ncbi:hypothetical protein M747DRAFT_31285 [Aspergillus niger ATCC 13496]|nr:hypothetical protein M747DRAFT_31285 [Aspergillus niger ATCC 13496]
MDPEASHWAIRSAPLCLSCRRPTTERTARRGNHLGHDGRPYFRCEPCNRFSCFGDMRGIHLNNPVCYCEGYLFSRRQIAGWDSQQKVRGAIHYVCAVGKCDFFEYCRDNDGRILHYTNLPEYPRSMGF